MLNKRSLIVCLIVALIVFALDQATKLLMLSILHEQMIGVLPHFNFTLAYNRGAAFGMFAAASGWQIWLFIVIAVVVSGVILTWSSRLSKKDLYENLAISFILGGAWGNLLDRIRFGHVIDFIDFYIGDWHWYTFNVADTTICIGAAILLFLAITKRSS